MTHPTKKLFDPDAKTQLVWTPSYSTNVSETFARIRREEANWKAFFDGLGEEMTADRYQQDAIDQARSEE